MNFVHIGKELPNEVNEGDVFIKHPFETNTYISAIDANEIIRKDKFMKIAEIAQCLGAKCYHVKEVKEGSYKRHFGAESKCSYKAVKANLDVKKEDYIKQKFGMDVFYEFKGCSSVSDEMYEKAIEKANMYNLNQTPEIKTLIKMRSPEMAGNSLNHKTISCEMTKEINDALDVGFSLNVLSGVFNLSTNIKSVLETKEEITLTMEFVFPES